MKGCAVCGVRNASSLLETDECCVGGEQRGEERERCLDGEVSSVCTERSLI